MDAKTLIEDLKTAIFQQDHELNCAKAFMAEVEKTNAELFHEIMERLNLV